MPATKGVKNGPTGLTIISPSAGPATRQSMKTPLTQNEIEAMSNQVTDYTSAEKYLNKNLLSLPDESFTLTHIISILFQITQMRDTTPLPVTTAIRAAAYILKKHAACEMASEVARQISDTLTPRIIEHVVGAIAPQMAKLLTTSDLLSTTLDRTEAVRKALVNDRDEMDDGLQISASRIETVADELHASVEECQNALKLLSPSLDTTQDRLNTLSTQLLTQQAPTRLDKDHDNLENGTNQNQRQTYSSIAAANLTPSIDKAIGRAAICAREILLDPTPGNTLFPPDTSHADMVEKMKSALANIRKPDTPVGDIRSITALHNGSFIIELETESLASWLRKTTSKEALTDYFGNTVSFRTRTYPIVAEYLPIQLQIQDDTFLRSVEQDNNLPSNSIISTRWIKPPQRRSANQRKAFALIHIADPHMANLILKEGICIQNERITVRKDKREPIRCAKCQRYGHIARNCPATVDVCGTCSNQHRTTECTSRNTICVNCQSHHHASWNRTCPDFIQRCELINEKFPENTMPYYPTELSWTHVNQPPRSIPTTYPAPCRVQSPRQKGSKQSTITFQPSNRSHQRTPQIPQSPTLNDIIGRLGSAPIPNFSDAPILTNPTNSSSSPTASTPQPVSYV